MDQLLLNAIKCCICKNTLNSPVILPCSHSVCKKHTTEVAIKCNQCGQEHQKQEFFPNQALEGLIQLANKDSKTGKILCEQLEAVIKQIEQLLSDPANFTYEEINELERELDLKRELLKKQIDDEFAKFHQKLEEYKQNCKNHLTTNEYKIEAEKIGEEVKKARNELKEWTGVLNEAKSNEPKWIKDECKKSIAVLENNVNDFKRELLLKNYFNCSKIEVDWLKNINTDSAFSFTYLR
jgi:hypothetical protein